MSEGWIDFWSQARFVPLILMIVYGASALGSLEAALTIVAAEYAGAFRVTCADTTVAARKASLEKAAGMSQFIYSGIAIDLESVESGDSVRLVAYC